MCNFNTGIISSVLLLIEGCCLVYYFLNPFFAFFSFLYVKA